MRPRQLYDEDAEALLLSDLIIDAGCVEQYIDRLSIADFTGRTRQAIFQEIRKAHTQGAAIDTKTIAMPFRDDPKEMTAVVQIAHLSPSSANAEQLYRRVRSFAALRQTAAIVDAATKAMAEPEPDGVAIAGDLERQAAAISLGAFDNGYKPAMDTMLKTVEQIERWISTKGAVEGVDIPFEAIRDKLAFRNGEYIVIGARPSVGKTAFAMNIVEDIAVRRKIPTGVFSIEMTTKQLHLRMVSCMSGVPLCAITHGDTRTSVRMTDKLMVACQEIALSPLYVDETNGLRLSELKTKARRMVRVDGVKIIFVDYFSLIVNDEALRLPRYEQMADVSRSIKNLAKELDIPIIVLSQLVRDVEGKRPTLSSLRETGTLEQDADVVLFLHREREADSDDIDTEAIIAKQRNGAIGTGMLVFHPKMTRFTDKVVEDRRFA